MIAGGPADNELIEQVAAGNYLDFVKQHLDGVNQLAYLTGQTDQSARDTFICYQGKTLSAVRYKNWKFYYTMADAASAGGWILASNTFNFTLVTNIKRDPFEQSVGTQPKTAMGFGGTLASPSTAFIYDWNLLPIGLQIALEHLETFEEFPPMQAPPSYNLDQVMAEIQSQKQMDTLAIRARDLQGGGRRDRAGASP